MAEFSGRYDVGSLESTERKFTDLQLVKRLLTKYVLKYKTQVVLISFIMFLKTVLILSGPYIYKVALDHFISGNKTENGRWLAEIIKSLGTFLGASDNYHYLLAAGILYFGVGLIMWCIMALQDYNVNKLGLNVIADIRSDFFRHMEVLSQNFFEYGNTGRLVSRVTNDAEALKGLVSSGIVGATADTITAFMVLFTMLFLDLQLALITLAIAPVLIISSTYFQKLVREAWRVARQNVASMTSKVQDLMYGAKVTKAMAQEAQSLEDFDKVNELNMNAQIQAEMKNNIYDATTSFLNNFTSALIWYFGGNQVIFAIRSLGDLVAFTQYAQSFLDPVQNLTTFYGQIQSALAGAERIFVVLDIEPEVRDALDAVDMPQGSGVVSFNDVVFSYVKDEPVLKDISFKTKPGERLAIFGQTGSGKSTIINLLGRFYDPNHGSITIDGVDLRNLKLKQLHQHVGIVLQEPYLFRGTIRYNLLFGNQLASEEEMIRVAQLVGIHEVIMRLPKKYDEEVQERGSNLSYGQRQLICVARTIIANPRILILDEATSSVDPYTEQLIQNALKAEMINRTIIIVTHRVSTVRDADRIIVLDHGEIQNTGTHNQLLKTNMLYRRLCEMQLVELL
ncbi:ABC transporter ATP-binding protein [Candidatus Bathyarchaeota archaeon]|nr:ABC transporter ATP-binding protein [Candidatus Bathyarchaeota archaeon]